MATSSHRVTYFRSIQLTVSCGEQGAYTLKGSHKTCAKPHVLSYDPTQTTERITRKHTPRSERSGLFECTDSHEKPRSLACAQVVLPCQKKTTKVTPPKLELATLARVTSRARALPLRHPRCTIQLNVLLKGRLSSPHDYLAR